MVLGDANVSNWRVPAQTATSDPRPIPDIGLPAIVRQNTTFPNAATVRAQGSRRGSRMQV